MKLAGWKPFRRRARRFLSRMNMAKKQKSEADKMNKSEAAASAMKMDSPPEESAAEKVLKSKWEEVKLDEMGQMVEDKVDKVDKVGKEMLAPWCDHPALEYWGGSW